MAGIEVKDFVKWVGLHESFDLTGDLVALPAQREQLSEFGQHGPGRTGVHDHNALRFR